MTETGRDVILDSDAATAVAAETQDRRMPSPDHPYETLTNTHLVKGEDLNHHKTLYGGRCVEWCVHMAYLTAQNCFAESRSLVFMSIRSLSMRSSARIGDMVQIVGRVDYVGESTIGIRIDAYKVQPKEDQKPVATGTFLFCTVDEEGKAVPHGLPALKDQSAAKTARWTAAAQEVATARN